MAVKVFDLVGEYALSSSSGQKLYDVIFPALKDEDLVEVDFDGVCAVASAFLNAAVGQLLRTFDGEQLNTNLKFLNLNSSGELALRHVIRNAKRYYSDEKYRDAVDEIAADYVASV